MPAILDDLLKYKTLGLVPGFFCSPEAGDSSGKRDLMMTIIYEWTSDHGVTSFSLTAELIKGTPFHFLVPANTYPTWVGEVVSPLPSRLIRKVLSMGQFCERPLC